MIDTLLIIIIPYYLISLFFFLYPTLIWQKKTYTNPIFNKILLSNKIMRIAHRGGPRHTTENTIQAFERTKDSTDCLEMDICETKDKILVVHHDHSLQRTCGIDRNISDYPYNSLPSFLPSIKLDFGVNQFVKTKQQKIPTLEQVFVKFNQISMNIELKTPTQTAMTQFAKLIYEHNKKNDTIVGIRNNQNFLFKKKNPSILNFTNDQKVYTILIAYFLGCLPYLPISQTSFQIPIYSREYEQWNIGRTPIKDKWRVSLYMKAMNLLNIVTWPLIWHLKRRGVMSFAWVCNSRESFDRAVRGGFQGIMTDDPILLDQYLKEKCLRVVD